MVIFWIKYLFNSTWKFMCFLSLYLHSNEQYLFKHFSFSSQKKAFSFISLLHKAQIFSFVLIIKELLLLFSNISKYINALLFCLKIKLLKLSSFNLVHLIYNLSTKFNPYPFNILKF